MCMMSDGYHTDARSETGLISEVGVLVEPSIQHIHPARLVASLDTVETVEVRW
jgi:hypothetical protein